MRILRQQLLPLTFFLFISLLIIFSWFRFGHLYGGGEVGIPTYDAQGQYERAKFIWQFKIGTGFLSQSPASVPLYFFLSIFQLLGFSPFWIQIVWFYLLLFLMGYGMYIFSRSVFDKGNKSYSFLAGLFYMFNPYMMIQGWHRFLPTSISFAAFLPFLLFFWLLWIRKGSFGYLLIFLLVNFLASYSYNTVAFVITIWIALGFITLTEILVPWGSRAKFVKLSYKFFLGLICWILTSSWWLLPTFSVGESYIVQKHSIGESVSTLILVAKTTILPYTIQLVNPFHVYINNELGSGYNDIFFKILPWFSVIAIFIGVFKSLKNKFSYLGLNYIVILFLTKGAASPFGYLYILGFLHITVLGVLRNPFEKIGIVLTFYSSLLFVLGIKTIKELLTPRVGRNMAFLLSNLVFLTMLIYCWPMFFGKIFGTSDKPSFVDVPKSYKMADDWIGERLKTDYKLNNTGKILHLPLTRGEAVTYNWQHGYRGVEDSATIFRSLPSISSGLNFGSVDDSLTGLSLLFNSNRDKKESILKALQAFGVKFIIIHKDVDWHGGDLYDPTEVEKLVDKLEFLGNKQTFGDLVVYELLDRFYESLITLSDSFQVIYPSDNMGIWPWLQNESGSFISPVGKKVINPVSFGKELLVFPENTYSYIQYSDKDLNNILASFSNTLEDPNSIITQLTKVKESLLDNGEIQAADFLSQLIKTTKKLFTLTGVGGISEFLEDYNRNIKDLLENKDGYSRLISNINNSIITDILQLHITRLKLLQENLPENDKLLVSQTLIKLRQYLQDDNILPFYNFNTGSSVERQVNKFQIPADATYEMLIADPDSFDQDSIKDKDVNININDKQMLIKGISEDGFISFGQVNLSTGSKEISYDSFNSSNLFPTFDKLSKQGDVNIQDNIIKINAVDHNVGLVEADIPHPYGGNIYRISLEYQIIEGDSFKIQLIQDTEPLYLQKIPSSEQEASSLGGMIVSRSQNNVSAGGYSSVATLFPPLNTTTKSAKIRFLATSPGPKVSILIRSPKIERVVKNPILLRSNSFKKEENYAGNIIEMNKINPTLYNGKVRIDNPSFLFFKESFHPGWKLTLSNSEGVYESSTHYIGNLYGNAWFIDKIGDFNFRLEFEPQKIVYKGIVLASICTGVLFSVFLVGFLKRKKHV